MRGFRTFVLWPHTSRACRTEHMYFPIDHVACDQARALAGKEQRFPEYNYSPVELNEVNVLRCASVLRILVLECILL
jgi:hypothetical protein